MVESKVLHLIDLSVDLMAGLLVDLSVEQSVGLMAGRIFHLIVDQSADLIDDQ